MTGTDSLLENETFAVQVDDVAYASRKFSSGWTCLDLVPICEVRQVAAEDTGS